MNYHNYLHHNCQLISERFPSCMNYVQSDDEDECESQRMGGINTCGTYSLIRIRLNYLQHVQTASERDVTRYSIA
jgi:hypothetical protein